MARECVKGDYKEVIVRALDTILAERSFRTKFGRAMDQIIDGANVGEVFKSNLGELNTTVSLIEMKNQTRFLF